MLRYASGVLIAVCAWSVGLSAQQAPQGTQPAASVDATEGRRLFHQKCSLCHVAPMKGGESYGPKLSKAQVNSTEAGVREIIRSGTGRMPGFQYALEPRQVAAIIAFLKTLDVPPDRIVIDTPNPSL